MSSKPIRVEGAEHYSVAVLEAADLQRKKGSSKYLGFIPELCIVCGACVDHCPWHCLFMIDSQTVAGQQGAMLVDDAIKTDEPQVIFWVDDDECTRCNVCVERCPTDAITMDKLIKPSKQRTLGSVLAAQAV